VAAAFLGSPVVQAQPSGAQAIHGQASLSQQGANLLVTTQNGAGTGHSAINWQSFSVPGGSTTHFQQPNAASLSINRVVGNNPSAIFGTLSSNGRLVLVNPSGIAVGAGAVVDTAGFTASTLRMSEADALAGRLVFGGDGLASGALSVDGKILARSGDVVLIGTNLQVGSGALVQSPSGATILAAGQKVELTGRGLEGIRMELQAPSDQALNLGTLQGDAVGIFAGQLKHSGLINASAVSAEGGKVVLRAGGDNLVDGRVVATAGNKGGAIDVLGGRVALFGNATLEASGDQGGGRIRVGGDYQGANPDVPNASSTFVGENVTIKADATQSGDGGRVIVWADDATRFRGQISARGGEQGGNGGFAEVSGKQYLEYSGSTDLRAPKGKVGTLLLDPNDITIKATGTTDVSQTPGSPYLFGGGVSGSVITEADLEAQLANSDVLIKTSTFSAGSGSGNITVEAALNWGTNALALEADNNISLQNTVDSTGMLIMITKGAGTITQSAGAKINVADLVLETSTGAVTLNENNMVGRLAASVESLSFTNNAALEIATLDRFGLLAGPVAGVTASNSISIVTKAGDLKMTSAGPVTGGAITLTAADSILGNGGMTTFGGAVTLNAGGAITFDTIYTVPFSGSVGFAGGAVTLTAGTGDISGNGIVTVGGSNFGPGSGGAGGEVRVTAASGSVTLGSIDAYGGSGAPGGAGGIVKIQAGGDVTVQTVDVSGGYGSSGGNGANGGNGGEIAIKLGGKLSVFDLYAGGGSGETGFNGGAGGNGGRIEIAKTSGSLALTDAYLDAGGGNGAYSNSMGSGGGGGAGGTISITATAGGLTLQDSSLWAASGWGPAGYGAEGTVQASGSSGTTVGGYVDFGGNWTHSGTMNIAPSAGIGGGGMFLNDGDINLGSESSIWADGGFINRSAGRLNLSSGFGFAGLTENHGLVDIASGASLFTDNFYLNQGTLRVMGTLVIGAGSSCTECAMTFVPPPSFAGFLTNGTAGVITGTGTVDLGGAGTLYNYGRLQPGDGQVPGTLTINGNLNMAPGSVLAIDVASAESYDRVHVAGTATFEGPRSEVQAAAFVTTTTTTSEPPAQIQVSYLPGASFAAGSEFNVLTSNELSILLDPVLVGAPELTIAAPATSPATSLNLLASTALTPPVPVPPAPAPLTGSLADQIAQLIDGDHALAAQVIAEFDTNPLTTFTTLLLQEEEKQASDGKGLDNLVDDNQCRR